MSPVKTQPGLAARMDAQAQMLTRQRRALEQRCAEAVPGAWQILTAIYGPAGGCPMIPEPMMTAMLAHADQHVAQRREDILKLVESYKQIVAQGRSSTVASGLFVLTSISALDLIEVCQLLSVAVMMLAEAQPDSGAVPQHLRDQLDEPAQAYHDEDPNAPKAGA